MVSLGYNELTHWGQVMHICMDDLTTIGSDKGLLPGRCQAIIRTNAGILLIGCQWNFSQTSVKFKLALIGSIKSRFSNNNNKKKKRKLDSKWHRVWKNDDAYIKRIYDNSKHLQAELEYIE